MKHLIALFIVLIFTLEIKSQDSTAKTPLKSPRHELGVGILYPTLVIFGAYNDNIERYTNLTYRKWFKEKYSFKAFAGTIFPNSMDNYSKNTVVILPGNTQLIGNTMIQTPSNCQFGFGFERYIGHKKLKLYTGIDVVYNNKFVKKSFYYTYAKDSAANSITKLDTGAYVSTRNFDKIGLNFNFGVRYEFNKQWVLTANYTAMTRFWQFKNPNGSTSQYFDLNSTGLISDISLFYRF
jgi:hypothetical protein